MGNGVVTSHPSKRGRPWEEMRERLCGVQAYSVRVPFYLVMHFCAWTSESPGQLSKNTCVGFIPRVQFGRSGVHLGIRIVLQLSRQFCGRARSGSHCIDQCFQSRCLSNLEPPRALARYLLSPGMAGKDTLDVPSFGLLAPQDPHTCLQLASSELGSVGQG